MSSSTPEGRFNREESELFAKKGWWNYAKRLVEWRWTGKDNTFPERQWKRNMIEATRVMQNGGRHDPSTCLDPNCAFDFRPRPAEPSTPPESKTSAVPSERLSPFGKKKPSKFKAEAVEPPKESTSRALAIIEEPPLRLSEAGFKPLEGGLSKGLAVLGGTAALGAIVLGGKTAAHGIWGYDDPDTGQHRKGDVGHLVVGMGEMGVGAVGLIAAVTGRLKLWAPLQAR